MQYLCIVHVYMYMHMHTYPLCGYTRHLRTCRYAAIRVNRPSGNSQAVAIAVNRTQGVKHPVKLSCNVWSDSIHIWDEQNHTLPVYCEILPS